MLTLLKQARAYGVGCVLATQNPVDLDYKGLSNCGTWLLGRLQTERDKARVIDGLESAASGGAAGLDRASLEKTLSGLDSRVFLMNNVHEDGPILLRSRWALSYLAGPLSRAQIKRLAKPPVAAVAAGDLAARLQANELAQPSAASIAATDAAAPGSADQPSAADRPVVPVEAAERFVPITSSVSDSERVIYRPVLVGKVSAHFANARAGVDEWTNRILWAPLDPDLDGSPWAASRLLSSMPELEDDHESRATFAPLPGAAERKASYTKWSKQLKTTVYRDHPLMLWKSKKPKLISALGEEEGPFRGRLADLVHEDRDLKLEKLRKKYAPKLARIQERIDRQLERVDREEQQYKDRKTQTIVSMGATMIGALFGRKLGSVGNVGRAATSIKGVSRAAREKADIGRAEARVEEYQQDLAGLEEDFRKAIEDAEDAAIDLETVVEELRINAKKGDLDVERLSLVWVPSRVGASGEVELIGTLEG